MSKYILVSPEEIYPPYLTRTPLIQHVVREMDAETYQTVMLRLIFYPEDLETNPKWQTWINQTMLMYTRIVLSEFIKECIDKSARKSPIFQDLNIKLNRKTSPEFKKLIKAEKDLWVAVWTILTELQANGLRHRAWMLNQIVGECSGLINLMYQHHSSDGKDGATDRIAQLQSENSRVRNFHPPDSNPFDPTQYPITFAFVHEATALARRCSRSHKQWMAVVRARMAITTLLRKSSSVSSLKDGSVLTAGRPKKLDA